MLQTGANSLITLHVVRTLECHLADLVCWKAGEGIGAVTAQPGSVQLGHGWSYLGGWWSCLGGLGGWWSCLGGWWRYTMI